MQNYLAQHAAATQHITKQDVAAMLDNVHGTTFASVVQCTPVKLAAANKHRNVRCVTRANVMLFNNLQAFTSAYANAVKRSAAKIDSNDAEKVDGFTAASTWFEHTDCYSVVKHKRHDSYYLYAIYSNAVSEYYIDGVAASKEAVAELMTASEAAKLLSSDKRVRNVTHDIEHDVVVRTVALENVVLLTAAKQTVGVQ